MSTSKRHPETETVEDLDRSLVKIDEAAAELRDVREGIARQRAEILGERYPSLRLVSRATGREMAEG